MLQRVLAAAVTRAQPRWKALQRAQCAAFATIYDKKVPYEDTVLHRSDAEQRIAKMPVIEVDGNMAVCDGGGGVLGHPLEYIQLDTVTRYEPQTCLYCGLRYRKKPPSKVRNLQENQ